MGGEPPGSLEVKGAMDPGDGDDRELKRTAHATDATDARIGVDAAPQPMKPAVEPPSGPPPPELSPKPGPCVKEDEAYYNERCRPKVGPTCGLSLGWFGDSTLSKDRVFCEKNYCCPGDEDES
mgnify:CR=1 FL=1|jgi:hypothetical protein